MCWGWINALGIFCSFVSFFGCKGKIDYFKFFMPLLIDDIVNHLLWRTVTDTEIKKNLWKWIVLSARDPHNLLMNKHNQCTLICQYNRSCLKLDLCSNFVTFNVDTMLVAWYVVSALIVVYKLCHIEKYKPHHHSLSKCSNSVRGNPKY